MENTVDLEVQEYRKRHLKYAAIMGRATVLGLMAPDEDVDRMMDIESADLKFNLRLGEWLAADNFNFAHDFYGIRDSINRESGFPATDFGLFLPRFAGKSECKIKILEATDEGEL